MEAIRESRGSSVDLSEIQMTLAEFKSMMVQRDALPKSKSGKSGKPRRHHAIVSKAQQDEPRDSQAVSKNEEQV